MDGRATTEKARSACLSSKSQRIMISMFANYRYFAIALDQNSVLPFVGVHYLSSLWYSLQSVIFSEPVPKAKKES
jgi:hypothetical protein